MFNLFPGGIETRSRSNVGKERSKAPARFHRCRLEPLERRMLLSFSGLLHAGEPASAFDNLAVPAYEDASARFDDAVALGVISPQQPVAPISIPELVAKRILAPAGEGRWYLVNQDGRASLTLNRNAADTTNTDQLWNTGDMGLDLTGSGVTVGIWDGGPVRSTHEKLTGRVTVVDSGVPKNCPIYYYFKEIE